MADPFTTPKDHPARARRAAAHLHAVIADAQAAGWPVTLTLHELRA